MSLRNETLELEGLLTEQGIAHVLGRGLGRVVKAAGGAVFDVGGEVAKQSGDLYRRMATVGLRSHRAVRTGHYTTSQALRAGVPSKKALKLGAKAAAFAYHRPVYYSGYYHEGREEMKSDYRYLRQLAGIEPAGSDRAIQEALVDNAHGDVRSVLVSEARRISGEVKELQEGKPQWIKGAIKKPGALRQTLQQKFKGRVPPKGKGNIPGKFVGWAAQQPGKMGKRGRLAKTLAKF